MLRLVVVVMMSGDFFRFAKAQKFNEVVRNYFIFYICSHTASPTLFGQRMGIWCVVMRIEDWVD